MIIRFRIRVFEPFGTSFKTPFGTSFRAPFGTPFRTPFETLSGMPSGISFDAFWFGIQNAIQDAIRHII